MTLKNNKKLHKLLEQATFAADQKYNLAGGTETQWAYVVRYLLPELKAHNLGVVELTEAYSLERAKFERRVAERVEAMEEKLKVLGPLNARVNRLEVFARDLSGHRNPTSTEPQFHEGDLVECPPAGRDIFTSVFDATGGSFCGNTTERLNPGKRSTP